ncbi:unnamed protein product [Polarella glacialis]|uniref:Uncharacterized protein n=1 Tax=Polarella glacialis TaxID=89957 RepID=A0A813DPR7_POLGL|nr:unnamed protein product [Polarella glacialis]
MTLLQEAGVVVEMRLKPQIVGVHPSNRDGYGVNPHDVHALLADIVDVGWSYQEVKAICVEVASDEVREWNAALMAGTNGMLPSFEKAAVRFASLSASHTNQALRCVLARVAHRDECLCVDGCLSLEKIGSKDPLFQDACTLGLTWAVLPATLLQEFPNLATILQAAGNCSGQVARGEHELQVVRRLHNLWREEAKKGPKVDFVEVKRKALRSKPPCAAAVPWMYAFILKFSGGKDADLLIESESFVRSTTTSTKSLGSDLYEVLSTDIKGTVNQFVRFRHALLKVAYVGSLTAGDAKKILGKEMTARIRAADDIMVETRQLVNSLPGCSHCDVRFVAVLGALDMDLATTTLGLAGKKKGGIASIAHECIIQLRLITGVEIASKFEAAALNEASVASQAFASTRDLRKPMSGELAMREINSSGGGLVADASVLIKEMGFWGWHDSGSEGRQGSGDDCVVHSRQCRIDGPSGRRRQTSECVSFFVFDEAAEHRQDRKVS